MNGIRRNGKRVELIGWLAACLGLAIKWIWRSYSLTADRSFGRCHQPRTATFRFLSLCGQQTHRRKDKQTNTHTTHAIVECQQSGLLWECRAYEGNIRDHLRPRNEACQRDMQMIDSSKGARSLCANLMIFVGAIEHKISLFAPSLPSIPTVVFHLNGHGAWCRLCRA